MRQGHLSARGSAAVVFAYRACWSRDFRDIPEVFGYAAHQVDQILKGAKAGEIPFYQVTKFELVINLKAAKTIGVTFPPSIMVQADEVIE
jgi:putative ABC transport system substrate-binding protein